MTRTANKPVAKGLPDELHSGDRMTQEEFHRIYTKMPEDFKAELIGGIVYVASPTRRRHGKHHLLLGAVFTAYEANTPGVDAADNTTVILANDAEPQPDLYLRILPEYGGQSQTTKEDYIEGAPELVAEIAHSTHALDLNDKKEAYAQFGVSEYLVVSLKENRLRWFDLRAAKELEADAQGICRIRTFPGLWIDSGALLKRAYRPLMDTLTQGLASAEHTEFVKRLASKRK